MKPEIVLQIQQQLDYQFKSLPLLKAALLHSSHADERLKSNERLEFLGDAVLGLVICQALYDRFPECLEGDLTKMKSLIVSRKTCARIAGQMSLPELIKVGKGTDRSRALDGSIAAGALEALIAAVYLDGGFEQARTCILKLFAPVLERIDAGGHNENYKSVLQQYSQRQYNITPSYELLDEKGPDHNKCFEVGVRIRSQHFPSAWGITKKEAEQKAAHNALLELEILCEPPNIPKRDAG